MLDDFKEKQEIAYNIMMNEINTNHISHAYLIDENNCYESFDFVIAFIKEILCIGLDQESRQVICRRIDDGNYPELKIIEPDGMLIKKQQILDLQKMFSMVAVEGNKRIYLIKDAEKMRSETANSMLKFLEEPENNIIAILMTNNFNNMLSTIISRCQIIRLNNELDVNLENDLDRDVLNFVKCIENDGINTIMNEQDILFNKINIKDREDLIVFFDKMIDMYYDIMKIVIGNLNVKYIDFKEEFISIANNYTYDKILDIINLLIKYRDAIKNNVNINLLVDSMIVSMGGIKWK